MCQCGVCAWVYVVRKLCVFTDNLTQFRISLHFLVWMAILCTASSTTFSPLLGDFSILAYILHSACDSPVHFSLCVSDTCFGNVAIRFPSFRQTTCRRIAALHELVFHFRCSKFDPLSAVFHFHSYLSAFTPSSVILKLSDIDSWH